MSERIWTRNLDAQEQGRNVQGGRQRAETEQEEMKGGMLQCPECGDYVVTDDEHDETVHNDCGLVVTTGSVDRGPEWRVFSAREKDEKSRVGAPMTNTTHDKGLLTNIDWYDRDTYGNSLDARQRQKTQRLRKWNEWLCTRDSKERNLKQVLGETDRMALALGLPENVHGTVLVICRCALGDNLLLGRSIEGVVVSCTCAAARIADVSRSFNEIAEVSRVKKNEVAHAYRYIARELSLEVKLADPKQYVSRFASELGLSDESKMRVHQLLRNVKGKGAHSGKSPVSLAAATIYTAVLLTNEKTTQAVVGDMTGISEVTIRNRYHEPLETEENLGLVWGPSRAPVPR